MRGVGGCISLKGRYPRARSRFPSAAAVRIAAAAAAELLWTPEQLCTATSPRHTFRFCLKTYSAMAHHPLFIRHVGTHTTIRGPILYHCERTVAAARRRQRLPARRVSIPSTSPPTIAVARNTPAGPRMPRRRGRLDRPTDRLRPAPPPAPPGLS